MADSPRSTGLADRNLLFGILALQMHFISRDQFGEATGCLRDLSFTVDAVSATGSIA